MWPSLLGYERCVFINTPFDDEYDPLATAILFTVFECGLMPRSAKEWDDSSETRIDKLHRLIRESRYSIHDLSRTELNSQGLPRFNMPFELGLWLGVKAAGVGRQRRKIALVLDSEPYRYQAFISDIAGQDIRAHGNNVARVIRAVRNWHLSRGRVAGVDGGAAIYQKFVKFRRKLGAMASTRRLTENELTYNDLCWLIFEFLRTQDANRQTAAKTTRSARRHR